MVSLFSFRTPAFPREAGTVNPSPVQPFSHRFWGFLWHFSPPFFVFITVRHWETDNLFYQFSIISGGTSSLVQGNELPLWVLILFRPRIYGNQSAFKLFVALLFFLRKKSNRVLFHELFSTVLNFFLSVDRLFWVCSAHHFVNHCTLPGFFSMLLPASQNLLFLLQLHEWVI